jgi:hypothetical protein
MTTYALDRHRVERFGVPYSSTPSALGSGYPDGPHKSLRWVAERLLAAIDTLRLVNNPSGFEGMRAKSDWRASSGIQNQQAANIKIKAMSRFASGRSEAGQTRQSARRGPDVRATVRRVRVGVHARRDGARTELVGTMEDSSSDTSSTEVEGIRRVSYQHAGHEAGRPGLTHAQAVPRMRSSEDSLTDIAHEFILYHHLENDHG